MVIYENAIQYTVQYTLYNRYCTFFLISKLSAMLLNNILIRFKTANLIVNVQFCIYLHFLFNLWQHVTEKVTRAVNAENSENS